MILIGSQLQFDIEPIRARAFALMVLHMSKSIRNPFYPVLMTDFNYFDDLERRIKSNEFISIEECHDTANRSVDYGDFKSDFDLTCKYLPIFARVDNELRTHSALVYYKHTLILASFLNNRFSTKLSREQKAKLEEAKLLLENFLSDRTFETEAESFPKLQTCRFLAAFALIYIHNVLGISSSTPFSEVAKKVFKAFEKNKVSFVTTIADNFNDFEVVFKKIVEIRDFPEYSAYSFDIPIDMQGKAETHLFTWFVIYAISAVFVLVVLSEIYFSVYKPNLIK